MPQALQFKEGKTHYDILELQKDCTKDDVSRAYMRLAVRWYPDKNKSDVDFTQEMFKMISMAYVVLSDDELRRKYDSANSELIEKNSSDISGIDPFETFEKFMARVLGDKGKFNQYSPPRNGGLINYSNSNSDSNSEVDFGFCEDEQDGNLNDDLFTEDEDLEFCEDGVDRSSG
ncbi:putative 40 kDa heat shock protein [Cryptosporidium felis]|nr:putative 40 kDa heat shock protein [Cryptosporidium felis]